MAFSGDNEYKLNSNLPIVISNTLIRGRQSMDLLERRLLYIALSKISQEDIAKSKYDISNDDWEFTPIYFTIREYIALMKNTRGLEKDQYGGSVYNLIVEGCKKLMNRQVEISNGREWIAWNWVTDAKVTQNVVRIQFHKNMKPFILWLKKEEGYTKFILKYVLPLKTSYSQRIYEILRSVVYESRNFGYRRIDVEDLRYMLGLFKTDKKGNERPLYPAYSNLKQRILDPSVDEINVHSDIQVSFSEIKKSRKVVSINFSVLLKSDSNEPWIRFMLWEPMDIACKLSEIAQKRNRHIVTAEALIKYSHENLARLIYEIYEEIIEFSKIRNSQAFFEHLLKKWEENEEEPDDLISRVDSSEVV